MNKKCMIKKSYLCCLFFIMNRFVNLKYADKKNNNTQKTSLFFKKKYFRFQQFYYFIQLLCLEDYNLYILI